MSDFDDLMVRVEQIGLGGVVIYNQSTLRDPGYMAAIVDNLGRPSRPLRGPHRAMTAAIKDLAEQLPKRISNFPYEVRSADGQRTSATTFEAAVATAKAVVLADTDTEFPYATIVDPRARATIAIVTNEPRKGVVLHRLAVEGRETPLSETGFK